MYADSYFAIGSSHKICEDYALAGTVEVAESYARGQERFFAAVADGCSSSRHTDIGARFLCLGAQEALRLSPPYEFNEHAVLPHACAMMGRILPQECLDSTLLLVYTTSRFINVAASGDGVIVARHRDGTIHTQEIEFNHNAPAYLSYQMDQKRLEAYTTGQLNTGVLEGGCGVRTMKFMLYDGRMGAGVPDPEMDDRRLDSRVTRDPETFWHIERFNRSHFDMVAVLSDGVHSFQKKNVLGQLENIPLQEVLQQLMKLKSVRGEFVTRRCKRFLSKYCAEHGWSHYDDFSMAAVYAEEYVEEE